MSNFNEELKTMLETSNAEIATGFHSVQEKHRNLQTQLDSLRAEMLRPHGMASGGNTRADSGFAGYSSPGEQFTSKADLSLARKTGRLRFTLDQVHPAFETKTLIDSTTLGFSTPGILNAQRIEGIVPLPRRRLTVRDLLRSKPITAGQIDWIQELVYTNAASPVVEGNEKQESADTFQIASERVRTLAHWLPISKNALDDLPELRRFIDENLIYGLKVIEEAELLFGDGSSEHLHGLYHQAPSYAGTYAAGADIVLDLFRHVILEMANKDEEVTAFVLNPKTWHDCELVKTAPDGANTGSYLVGDPSGGTLKVPTLWGRAVVVTPAMPAGSFLAGNFSMGVIGDRLPATLDISDSHSDYFIRNKLALRCESRISLAVLRASSFMKGTL